jgi:hypothetical protein
VDLSTITDPFKGDITFLANLRGLPLERAKEALYILAGGSKLTTEEIALKRLRVGPSFPFISESSGPNVTTAFYGVVEDAISLLLRPSHLKKVLLWL